MMDPPDPSSMPSAPPAGPSEHPTAAGTPPEHTDQSEVENTTHGVRLPEYNESTPLVDATLPIENQPAQQSNDVNGTATTSSYTSNPEPSTPDALPQGPPSIPCQPLDSQQQGIMSPYPTEGRVSESDRLPYPPLNAVPPTDVPLPLLPYPPTNGVSTPTVGNPYPPPTMSSQPGTPMVGGGEPGIGHQAPLITNETETQGDGRSSRRSRRGLLKLPSYRGGRDYPSEPPPSYEECNPIPVPENIAPRQPSQTPNTSYVPPAAQIVERHFSDSPVYTVCPGCRERVRTVMTYVPGILTYLLFCLFLVIGWWFLCCFIPFCVPAWQDIEHVCPNCKRVIGKYDRLG